MSVDMRVMVASQARILSVPMSSFTQPLHGLFE